MVSETERPYKTTEELGRAVWENLHNRYSSPDEVFDGDIDGECKDLIAYAADMENCTVAELRPHVHAWHFRIGDK